MITKASISLTRTGFAVLIVFILSFALDTTATHAVNVISFGDSITAGYASNTGGYPPKLSDQLNANNKPAAVYNYGVYSEHTWDGLWRFDSVLASTPTPPSYILIMEGTNDIVVGLSVGATQWNLQGMIDKAKTAHVAPMISTLTPADRSGSLIPNIWNPMIIALAASNGIHLVDNYAATAPVWGAINSGDGLHPNDDGYQIIASTWYATLAPMITSTTPVVTTPVTTPATTEATTEASTATTTEATSTGGGGGGCFIATAAFGSPIEKHVMLLKEFRDSYLRTNSLGRQFVETYYHFSPPAADYISRHENLRLLVRVFLYPLIFLCYVLLKLSLPMQLALATLTVASGLVFSVVVIRRHRNA